MKKIFILALLLTVVTAGSAFAVASKAPATADEGKSLYATVSGTAANTDTMIGKMSKGVYAGWTTSTVGYIITTQHISGSKSFGSAHDSTAIYRNDTKQTAAPDGGTPILGANYFTAANAWTAM